MVRSWCDRVGMRLLAACLVGAVLAGCGASATVTPASAAPETVAMGYLAALFNGDEPGLLNLGDMTDRPFVWEAIGGFAGITLPPTVMYSAPLPDASGAWTTQIVAIRFNGLPRHPDSPDLPDEWRFAEDEQAYVLHTRVEQTEGQWRVAYAALLPMPPEPPLALRRIGDLLLTARTVTISGGSGAPDPRTLNANEQELLAAAFTTVVPVPAVAVLDREPVPAGRYQITVESDGETYAISWLSATRLTVTASYGGNTGSPYALADFRQLDRRVLDLIGGIG